MSLYDPTYSREWYLRNKDRLKPIRDKYNKQYSARPEVIEKARLKNSKPKSRARRKLYKKTTSGRIAERRYLTKPEVKQRLANNRLKTRYGITTQDYELLVVAQNGVCAICLKSDGKKLHIDHSHITNRIRGLLCGACNRGLGMFKDAPELLEKAKQYLEKNV